MSDAPRIIVLAGANGAGKSTAAAHLLPPEVVFVNADEVAKLLPNYPSDAANLQAGKIVLNRLDELERERRDIAYETTLSGLTLARRVERLRRSGYSFSLIFLWTPNPEFSIERVAARVRSGGHDIPEETIRRRHAAGIANFVTRYRLIADEWRAYNSTEPIPVPIAVGRLDRVDEIHNGPIWSQILRGATDA